MKLKQIINRIIVIAVILGSIYFVYTNLSELEHTVYQFLRANIIVLMPVLGLSVIYISLYARIIQVCMKLTGTRLSYYNSLHLWLSSYFVNTIIPSGFFSGITYLMLKAKYWNKNKVNLVLGVVLALFIIYVDVLIIFGAGLVFHIVDIQDIYTQVAIKILFFVVLLIIVISFFAVRHLPTLIKIFLKIKRKIFSVIDVPNNKISLIDPLQRASIIIQDLSNNWLKMLGPALDGMILHILSATMLWLVFWSLGYSISPIVLVAGYIVGTLLTIVSITPAGLGFVEVLMPIVISQFDIPLPVATAATLIWRLFSVWIMLFAGFISFRQIEKKTKSNNKSSA